MPGLAYCKVRYLERKRQQASSAQVAPLEAIPPDLAGGAAPEAQQVSSRAALHDDGAEGAEVRPPFEDTFQALVRAIHSGPWRDAPAWWSTVQEGIPQADTLSPHDRLEAAKMLLQMLIIIGTVGASIMAVELAKDAIKLLARGDYTNAFISARRALKEAGSVITVWK